MLVNEPDRETLPAGGLIPDAAARGRACVGEIENGAVGENIIGPSGALVLGME